VQYGPDGLQFAELRFPPGRGPFPVLLVVHGGFWSAAYDLEHIGHLCANLTATGIVTCNIEYRRVGNPGGGWPGTFQDVAVAAEYLRKKLTQDSRVDPKRSAVIGHSAGGHLALWLGGRHWVPEFSQASALGERWPRTAISLAGVTDLAKGWDLRLGGGAVNRLMGGGPERYPERYAEGSPIELLPTGTKQVLIHGTDDEIVPASFSESFVEKARALGDDASLVTLKGVGHFELIDPRSNAWKTVASRIQAALGR